MPATRWTFIKVIIHSHKIALRGVINEGRVADLQGWERMTFKNV